MVNLKESGVHPVTACRWYREGKLPVPARRAGRLILVDPVPSLVPAETVAVYARVSTEAALSAQGRRLLVVDPAKVDDDLVRDVTEILASLCAGLHGRRAATNRARRAVEAATGADA
jgi:predicted site-specific integrase-resolvase